MARVECGARGGGVVGWLVVATSRRLKISRAIVGGTATNIAETQIVRVTGVHATATCR